MHHTGTHDLDPSGVLTNAASDAVAEHTGHVNLCAGLDKGEETRTQARFGLLSEKLFMESLESALQVGECDALVHDQTLYLMEHRRVSRVEGVAAKHTARTDDPHRR